MIKGSSGMQKGLSFLLKTICVNSVRVCFLFVCLLDNIWWTWAAMRGGLEATEQSASLFRREAGYSLDSAEAQMV